MPDVSGVDVSPSGWLYNKIMMPRGSIATTNPLTGNITYDPSAVQGLNDDELQNVMAHEMTHSRQAQTTPWYQTLYNQYFGGSSVPSSEKGRPLDNPYFWHPAEQEAFQTERNRMFNQHQPFPHDPMTQQPDIFLPNEKVMRR